MGTTFIVKDRVLGHNPAAALYTAKFYYKRVLDEKTFPEPRKEAVEAEEAAKKKTVKKTSAKPSNAPKAKSASALGK